MAGRFHRWVEGGFALLALTIFTLACHAMWPDKDGVAAWFQAIGSVVAIFVAVWVPARQRKLERDDRNAERMEASVVLASRLHVLANDFVFLLLAMGVKEPGKLIFELDIWAVDDLLCRLRDYERDETDHVRAGLAFDLRRLVRDLRKRFPTRKEAPYIVHDNEGAMRDFFEGGEGLIAQTRIFLLRAEEARAGT